MRKSSSSTLFWTVTTGLAVAVGCATSNGPATEDSSGEGFDASVTNPSEDGGACPCSGDFVCVNKECVPANTDFDGDGYTVVNDCDDSDKTIHPGATEVCDDKDNNCNGEIDEGFDQDFDTYYQCAHGSLGIDCNDKDPNIHPGATEVCNDVDDNCDGTIDEGFDKDGDTFFACAHGNTAVDCDDNDPTVYPGAKEICDNKDNNCDGLIDNIPANVTTNDTFNPQNSHWATNGTAEIFPSQEYAQLTPDQLSSAGTLWWVTNNGEYIFDHFVMQSYFMIEKNTPQADGMAFAWVPIAAVDGGSPPRGVGTNGKGYGFVGLGGYGVAVDTYQNVPTEPAPPYLAIVDGTTGNQLVRNIMPLVNVVDGTSHSLNVTLITKYVEGDGGSLSYVTVSVDGTVYINEFLIPGYVPFAGRWGFTAGTGGFSESHSVTDISMSFPDGQGCIK